MSDVDLKSFSPFDTLRVTAMVSQQQSLNYSQLFYDSLSHM